MARHKGKTNLSHDGLNPAHVPYWWVNNPTLGEFCFTMIGRADIEGSKSNVAMNAWLPQASYPCGNFSDTSSFKFRRTKGSIGHAFTVRIRTGNQNQTSFYPFVPHEISVLVELILGHLRYLLTDVPPQPNSPPDNVFRPDRPAEADLGSKKRGSAPLPIHGISKITLKVVVFHFRFGLESSSTGSSFPADSAKPVPLAVVSLDSRQGQWESHDEAFGYLKRVIVTPAVYPRLVEFLHFDIQSTGQKSHCVNIRRDHRNAFSELTVRRPGKRPRRAPDGFGTGTPVPSPQSQSFSRGYGSILPTSLAYIVPSTRGCSPWRPDAVMSTTGRGRHSVLRIFKGRRGRTGHHATCGALPAAGPYLRLSRFQGGQACRSHGTFPLFGLQSSHLNICYYHQDLHRRPLRPGSRPGFCSDRRALLLIGACAQLGTVTQLPVHPASPVLLTKNGPLGALDSMARLHRAAAPSYLFKSFAPIPKSDERFARQYRCGPPPEFPLASPRSGIVHHLSGPDRYALTRTLHRRSGSVGGATHRGIPPISFLAPYGFTRPLTRTHVRLLGPCFKTGRMGSPQADARSAQSFSSFPRGTCSLSVSRQYLALDGIYRPIGAAFPNNPTRRQRLVVRQGPGTTGLSPSLAPPSRGLGPGPPLRTLLQTTIRTPRATDFHGGLFPVRSPLLRESLLVSFPPLIDMLKLSGRALGLMASGATCVQRLDGSRDSAIHTKYRISLRSSSMQEPRYPLPRVILFVFHKSKNFTSDYEIRMPPTVPVNHYSDPEGQHNRIRILWCYPMLMYTEPGITAAAGTRLALQWILVKGFRLYSFQLPDSMSPGRNLNDASPAQRPCDPTSYHESSKQQAEPVLTFYLINASLPEVGVCCTY
uniref:Senescence-associated protein n=1 Tax=Glycine max TaxID=3847 RepID=A0A0R0GHB6_SOYBN